MTSAEPVAKTVNKRGATRERMVRSAAAVLRERADALRHDMERFTIEEAARQSESVGSFFDAPKDANKTVVAPVTPRSPSGSSATPLQPHARANEFEQF